MKKLAVWTKKKSHALEIIHCADDTFSVVLHDAVGASAEGFGPSIDEAFVDAQTRYMADRRRSTLTVSRYARRAP